MTMPIQVSALEQTPDPRADPDSPLRDTSLHTPARAPKLQLPFQPSARGSTRSCVPVRLRFVDRLRLAEYVAFPLLP